MPRTYAEIETIANGAHFVKADLHLHSYCGSVDVNDQSMTVAAIIDAAIAKGIAILSITDHNSATNLDEAVEYSQRYLGQLLFVPGVEISTSNGHLLAYFSEVRRVDELLVFLRISGRSKSSDGHTAASMADVLSQVRQLGGVAIAAHIDREKSGFEMQPGYPSWKRDIITHQGLFGVECDEATSLTWFTLDDSGPNSPERRKLFQARKDSGVRWEIAHTQSSDAHSLRQFIDAADLTRIKLDQLSFDAFQLALTDPAARVRAIAQLPSQYSKIIGASVDGGFIANQDFHFSQNLNCLFGGRGAGKSTALRAIAHALGAEDTTAERPDCPAAIAVYVEDNDGAVWCYSKEKDKHTVCFAVDDPTKILPEDSFAIEYYGQNDLARVSESLTSDGKLLQAFLDTHLSLGDLNEKVAVLASALRDVAAILYPMETSFASLPKLNAQVAEFDRRLKAAEEGKLKEVAAAQASLANERQFLKTLRTAVSDIAAKISLNRLRIDLPAHEVAAGTLLAFKTSVEARSQIATAVQVFNKSVSDAENQLIVARQSLEASVAASIDALSKPHTLIEERINVKMAELQASGLKGNIQDLQSQIRSRTKIAEQVAALQRRLPELEDLRQRRTALLESIKFERNEWERRRREQLKAINRSLARTIADFQVIFLYEKAGEIDAYFALLSSVMNGSYFPDDAIRRFCAGTVPGEIAKIILSDDLDSLLKIFAELKIDSKWVGPFVKRFSDLHRLYELQEIWKPASPRIKVLTKTHPTKELPVGHLSDGQRHTILLTVAMLSDSYLPLLIDQPEDDLDNAFIFSTVVSVLREVKEKRQVIIVTHNANIAVLGDSELMFPMKRDGDVGTIFDAGSIDREVTRDAVQNILEGGRAAFQRRAEIYHIA